MPSTNFEFLSDVWSYLWERRAWWIAPPLIVLALLGVVLVFAEGSALAPFIYTLF